MCSCTLSPRARISPATACRPATSSATGRRGATAGPAGSLSAHSSRARSCRHRLMIPAAGPGRATAVSVFSTVSCSSRSCSRRSTARDRTTNWPRAS
ncbi:MAG: hypothetical protein ACLPKI_15025 [Streptosporangiaceae bacterium]